MSLSSSISIFEGFADALFGKHEKYIEQAWAELGQAQLKLGLGFTSTIDN